MNTIRPKTASEPDYAYVLTGPEIEAAEIIRLAHLQRFNLTIAHEGGVFAVRLVDTAAGRFIEGHGHTFEEAWRSLPGAELGDTFGARIAAHGKPTGSHLRIVEVQ